MQVSHKEWGWNENEKRCNLGENKENSLKIKRIPWELVCKQFAKQFVCKFQNFENCYLTGLESEMRLMKIVIPIIHKTVSNLSQNSLVSFFFFSKYSKSSRLDATGLQIVSKSFNFFSKSFCECIAMYNFYSIPAQFCAHVCLEKSPKSLRIVAYFSQHFSHSLYTCNLIAS